MNTIASGDVLKPIMYAKGGKNSKQSLKKVGNPNKQYSHGKVGKKNASVQKQSYNYSDYERSSSTSSPESSLERRPKERPSRSRTRRTGKSTEVQSNKSPVEHNAAPKQGETQPGKSTTLNVLSNSKSSAKIFPSKSYGVGQNLSYLKSKSAFRTSMNCPGKSVSFKTSCKNFGRATNIIKNTSFASGIYRRKLSRGMKWLQARPGNDSKFKILMNGMVKDGDIHKLPCGESGKWKYIRMYQERARRREARKRRQRQKQREEASGKKSTRRRRKSRKRSKSKKRKSRSRRRKSTSRKRSKSKRRRRSS